MAEDQSVEAVIAFLLGALIFLSLFIRSGMVRLRLPPPVGLIALGIGLGYLDAEFGVIGATGTEVVRIFGSIGIVALLFRVGLESDLAGLRRQLPQSSLIWIANMTISGGFGFLAGWLLGLDLLARLVLAVAFSATSVGVSVALWRDAGMLRGAAGQKFLDVAELDDVSGIALMALLFAVAPVIGGGDGGLGAALGSALAAFAVKIAGFGAFCYVLSRFAERRFVGFWQRRMSETDLTILTAAVGVMIAAGSAWIGLSFAVGALFAGFVFSRDRDRVEESHAYGAFVDAFAPFFFISIGLTFRPDVAADAVVLAVPLFVAAVLGKMVGTTGPALLKMDRTSALALGVSMVPRAEITMVITERARHADLIDDTVFGAILVVVMATCITAPPVLARLLARLRAGRQR